jgi:hypothetical protein
VYPASTFMWSSRLTLSDSMRPVSALRHAVKHQAPANLHSLVSYLDRSIITRFIPSRTRTTYGVLLRYLSLRIASLASSPLRQHRTASWSSSEQKFLYPFPLHKTLGMYIRIEKCASRGCRSPPCSRSDYCNIHKSSLPLNWSGISSLMLYLA